MMLENKEAIATGSARGTGKAVALQFARKGAVVVVNDVDLEKAEELGHQIKSQGGQALMVRADVSNQKEVEEMVKSIYFKFGKIDILVNNAGIIKRGSIEDHSYDEWNKIIDVNLTY
ncbi:hypothetical protein CEE35_08290 [Candidatus Aerophobetes bacterium Ae_b3b]|nr:MAG: hypothetical protein CEE35_08290 [Candidatus Aerophobetes bacterium Ae_b3b]